MSTWRSMMQWVQRLFVLPGFLIASGDAVAPEYDSLTAMSTLSRFPWVWIAVTAISTDIASRDLVAVRHASGNRAARRSVHHERALRPSDRELVDDPALELLRQPNAGTDGVLFIEQLVADRSITGNAYIWRPSPVAIYRLHPSQTQVLPGPMGIPVGYEVRDPASGERRILPPEEVRHIRGISWQDTSASMYGESVIRCLQDDLNADLGARQTAARLTKKGRPDILFSVKGGVGKAMVDTLQRRWEDAIRSLHGAFVVGAEVTAQQLSWTPKDFGDTARTTALRDTVLAAFGVPPTRAFVQTASFGANRQEARVYWERLIGLAREFERAFSWLAAPGVRIEFDFSTVEALQVSYTERLMRVSTWVGMGASPKAAAEYEGFDEAPVGETVDDFHSPRPIDRQPEEQQEDRDKALAGRVHAAVAVHLREAEASYAELGDEVDASLISRFLGVRLYQALTDAGIDKAEAKWWAEEIAAITDEARRMGADGAFGADRAQRTADRIIDATRRPAAEAA